MIEKNTHRKPYRESLSEYIGTNADTQRISEPTNVTINASQSGREGSEDRIKNLEKEILMLKEEFKRLKEKANERRIKTSVHYRKNKRVIYLPKKPIYEEVLRRLRRHEDEPLGITLKRVFEVAAKSLGITIYDEN